MSDDPADWVRQLRDSIRVDPEIPPGVVVLESGSEQVARTFSHASVPADVTLEELAEDLYSLHESHRYFIRLDGRSEPVPCEFCRTLVAQTPESEGVRGPWRPGIWEPETGRRHTLRRCEWRRANP